MSALRWARLNADLKLRLRRGAWYRVLELRTLEAVLDVNGVRVNVPRPFLKIVATPPRRWAIVRPRATRPGRPDVAGQYAVCPNCREREPIDKRMSSLRCGRCNGLFEVDWNDASLSTR